MNDDPDEALPPPRWPADALNDEVRRLLTTAQSHFNVDFIGPRGSWHCPCRDCDIARDIIANMRRNA